jgi:lipopolysaccharide transport system ATP-binding protein
MRAAIRVDNLSKHYRIGTRGRGSSLDLRETIVEGVKGLWSRLRRRAPDLKDEAGESDLWALKDVSFEVGEGEVFGIIGRNGAGKSTLLKILSQVVEPTSGRVEMRGRLGSLLEVGTGFHPELTGRENIYLNGSILGMSRKEIDRKFDEIVAFSEIERFLETPVKRYSSGMYTRLAFAVAAHLEPEILIVDEVLAVGDTAFQEKCLGKMKEVGRSGRTILFVSHNLSAVRQLCGSCIWLEQGRVKEAGRVGRVVANYSHKAISAAEGMFDKNFVGGNGRVELLSYRVTGPSGMAHGAPVTNEDVLIHVRVRAKELIRQPACGVHVFNEQGVLLTTITTMEQEVSLKPLPAGETEILVRLHKVPFLPGRYTAGFWIMNHKGNTIFAIAENSIPFEIGQGPLYQHLELDERWGCVYTPVDFMFAS